MKSFVENERCCEITFLNLQSCFHSYTNGKDAPLMFVTDRDMAFVMNVIAQAAFLFKGQVLIIAFTVMNNHLHMILSGLLNHIEEFSAYILKRIKRAFSSSAAMAFSHKPIDDLSSMRNHIVYVHRNGYVANHDFTPFSYPWGTGACYFLPEMRGALFQNISSIDNRSMFRSRDVHLPSQWRVVDLGKDDAKAVYIAPSSFCAVALGMSFFRDAHHYFAAISKNVEAYSGIAVELDDGEFLTDQELFSKLIQKVRDQFRVSSLRELSKSQRLELAKSLHYDYKSSNGQIRRVLGLSAFEVDSLFPLSAK